MKVYSRERFSLKVVVFDNGMFILKQLFYFYFGAYIALMLNDYSNADLSVSVQVQYI